jgi:hypothetical protein
MNSVSALCFKGSMQKLPILVRFYKLTVGKSNNHSNLVRIFNSLIRKAYFYPWRIGKLPAHHHGASLQCIREAR